VLVSVKQSEYIRLDFFIGLMLMMTQVLLGLAIYSISILFYNVIKPKIHSDLNAAVMAVFLPVLIIPIYLLLIALLSGRSLSQQTFNEILKSEFVPRLGNYAIITGDSALANLARIPWAMTMILVWAKYYISGFFVFQFTKEPSLLKDPFKVEAIKNDSVPIVQSTPLVSGSPSECPFCGTKLNENSTVCPNCRRSLIPQATLKETALIQKNQDDVPSIGLNILGFFIPLAGLILYMTWSYKYPVKMKAVGKWTLVGFFFYLFLIVLWVIFVLYIFYGLTHYM
jgi:hypothetical protein